MAQSYLKYYQPATATVSLFFYSMPHPVLSEPLPALHYTQVSFYYITLCISHSPICIANKMWILKADPIKLLPQKFRIGIKSLQEIFTCLKWKTCEFKSCGEVIHTEERKQPPEKITAEKQRRAGGEAVQGGCQGQSQASNPRTHVSLTELQRRSSFLETLPSISQCFLLTISVFSFRYFIYLSFRASQE